VFPGGFEPAIPAGKRLKNHPLDRATTEIVSKIIIFKYFAIDDL